MVRCKINKISSLIFLLISLQRNSFAEVEAPPEVTSQLVEIIKNTPQQIQQLSVGTLRTIREMYQSTQLNPTQIIGGGAAIGGGALPTGTLLLGGTVIVALVGGGYVILDYHKYQEEKKA